jgi:hypothetical protein
MTDRCNDHQEKERRTESNIRDTPGILMTSKNDYKKLEATKKREYGLNWL